ncbi:MAG: hypothetical protein ACRDHZ_17695, partial [Ktedonobacteraceae bacterium]
MNKRRAWIRGEIVQMDGTSPVELEWTCPKCGYQPPIALAGNRFVKRRCVCERESLERQGREIEKIAADKGQGQRMTPLGRLLLVNTQPPPADLVWTCPVCGVIEPFALPSGRWIRRVCACQRRVREEQERAETLEHWKQEQLQRTFGGWLGARWVDTDVVRTMAKKTFDTYNSLRQPEAFEKAYAFAQNPRGNLLFYSLFGTGKTHLEAGICNYRREAGAVSGCSDLR